MVTRKDFTVLAKMVANIYLELENGETGTPAYDDWKVIEEKINTCMKELNQNYKAETFWKAVANNL